MEQDPPNAVASASSEDGGGDSVGKVKSNNQEEEDEEAEREDSAYGSGDFDDQSKAGASESEVRACVPCADSSSYRRGSTLVLCVAPRSLFSAT